MPRLRNDKVERCLYDFESLIILVTPSFQQDWWSLCVLRSINGPVLCDPARPVGPTARPVVYAHMRRPGPARPGQQAAWFVESSIIDPTNSILTFIITRGSMRCKNTSFKPLKIIIRSDLWSVSCHLGELVEQGEKKWKMKVKKQVLARLYSTYVGIRPLQCPNFENRFHI